MTVLAGFLTLAVHAGTEPYGTLPTPAHMAYHRREVVAIVHWGLNTFTGQEWGFGNVSPDVLKPDALDPDQWVSAMAAGGIKAVILVCKHHDGFCLWPSPLNKDYSMSAVPGKFRNFNVVKAVEQACRRRGMDFGAYLSPWDRRQASYGTDEYVEYFHAQWNDLMTNYGDICEIWLDGANGGTGWYGGANGGKGEKRSIPGGYYQKMRLRKALHEKHPLSVAFGGGGAWSLGWCGNEAGIVPETWWNVRPGSDGKRHWFPCEADTPFRRGGWFYHTGDKPKPMALLVDIYFKSVGRGGVLNLGIAPDKRGRICDDDVARLKEFGDWIRDLNSRDLAKGAACTSKRDDKSLVMELALPAKTRFNCVDIRENIELGQRVESYTVEVNEGGKWREAGKGTTVGYRRLARFADVEATGVRVTLKGRAAPQMLPIALRLAKPSGDTVEYRNPVSKGDMPDPTVWLGHDGRYYASSTTHKIMTSKNLVDWEDTGKKLLLPEEIEWIKSQNYPHIWAPDVIKIGGEYRLYICFHNTGSHTAIACYSSRNPSGPFTGRKILLTSEGVGRYEVIDPEVVRDHKTGKYWLFFGHGSVRRVELSQDARSLAKDAKIEHVAGIALGRKRPTAESPVFEARGCEGPYLHFHGGKWYLFLSHGWWGDHSYRMVVGRSDTIDGEFIDREGRRLADGYGTILLKSERGDEFFGPGHNGEIFRTPAAKEYMFFHCHWTKMPPARKGGYCPRPMFLQEIRWGKDGWPYFPAGKVAAKGEILKM